MSRPNGSAPRPNGATATVAHNHQEVPCRFPFRNPVTVGPGIELSVHDSGGDGPAVVLCHGFPDLACTWEHQVDALAQAGYRAIAPDMRGYGASSAPDGIDAYGP